MMIHRFLEQQRLNIREQQIFNKILIHLMGLFLLIIILLQQKEHIFKIYQMFQQQLVMLLIKSSILYQIINQPL